MWPRPAVAGRHSTSRAAHALQCQLSCRLLRWGLQRCCPPQVSGQRPCTSGSCPPGGWMGWVGGVEGGLGGRPHHYQLRA